MGEYSKAIAAFLDRMVVLVALWVPAIGDIVSPEVVAAISTLIGTFLVYWLKNEVATK